MKPVFIVAIALLSECQHLSGGHESDCRAGDVRLLGDSPKPAEHTASGPGRVPSK